MTFPSEWGLGGRECRSQASWSKLPRAMLRDRQGTALDHEVHRTPTRRSPTAHHCPQAVALLSFITQGPGHRHLQVHLSLHPCLGSDGLHLGSGESVLPIHLSSEVLPAALGAPPPGNSSTPPASSLTVHPSGVLLCWCFRQLSVAITQNT